jgi:hypothetical protein
LPIHKDTKRDRRTRSARLELQHPSCWCPALETLWSWTGPQNLGLKICYPLLSISIRSGVHWWIISFASFTGL